MFTVLVRNLPKSFTRCLRESKSEHIDVVKAEVEHQLYVKAISSNERVFKVITIPSDEACPDCVFVEDNAVVYNGTAVISMMGAPSRRDEVSPIAKVLSQLGQKIKTMSLPATLDGGDVMIAGEHVFVGCSSRTNYEGFVFLRESLQATPSSTPLSFSFVPVPDALHLKSIISYAGKEVGFLAADTEQGRVVANHIQHHYSHRHCTQPTVRFVPDATAANVLRIFDTIYFASHFPRSQDFFQNLQKELRGKQINFVGLASPEMNKADAALTCCSILVSTGPSATF